MDMIIIIHLFPTQEGINMKIKHMALDVTRERDSIITIGMVPADTNQIAIEKPIHIIQNMTKVQIFKHLNRLNIGD